MAFTSEKAARIFLAAAFAMGVARGAEFKFEVRHEHLRKSCTGTMTINEKGIWFHGAKDHAWSWAYQDIQELKLAPDRIHLLSYWDNSRRLGADRAFDFTGRIPGGLYTLWKDRLDQRFVAEVADGRVKPLWEIPAKHLGRIEGSQGVLSIGEDRIVYKTARKEDSRTWRMTDIDNISHTGRFDLTITTPEKQFRFQLKQVLSEARYNELWRKLNDTKGRSE
jgi:hypothetical protein